GRWEAPAVATESPRSAGGRLVAELDHALANRVLDQLGPAAQVELVHDVGLVSLDRLDAQEQAGRDLLVAVPVGDELQDLALADAQRHGRRRPAGLAALGQPNVALDHAVGDGGTEVG